ncbi:MAG TPA: hypothetical protein VFQ26_04770, partial [Nitrospiraceae bacterium]|nr:hypothetical protein [Nitrospiraceae bacterium]
MLDLKRLRKVELARRVGSLPGEVAAWRARSNKPLATTPADVLAEKTQLQEFQSRFATAHSSQLAAIEAMVQLMVEGHSAQAQGMDPGGDGAIFTQTALDLVLRTVVAQRFWDYFRDKLELRFSPQFGRRLWVADSVAYDCYTPVIQTAVDQGILPEGSFREPPLTYLNAETSPLTWLRSQRPREGGAQIFSGSQSLPFPVIELPWEQMENLWELMALHHEVGHDLEKDLNLVIPIETSLREKLIAAGVDPARRKIWNAWRKEVFADLVALQLGGPAFARSLAS